MKKKQLYISMLITILLASCAGADEMSGPEITDTEYPAIQFNPLVSSSSVDQTRVLTGTDGTGYFPTGDHNIGIYMMEENTTTPYTFTWEGVGTSATQYSNVRATLNANRSATPIHKWSSFNQYNGGALTPANRMTFGHASLSATKTADFYAYYPHVATIGTNGLVPITGIPFTLSETSNVTDVLYARHDGFSYDADVVNANPVLLDFRHALSLISFTVINQGKEDVIVSGGGVVDMKDAAQPFVYTACTMDLSTASVGTDGTNSSCTVVPNTSGTRSTVLSTNVTVAKDGGTSTGDIVNITLPYVQYTLGAQPEIRAYLTVSYATSSTGGFATSYGTLKVPEIGSGTGVYGFQQGYKYSYDITVTSTGISFGDVKIAEWVGATTQPGAII